MSQARRIETTLLVLIALLLAVATIRDLVRQAGVNERFIADLKTWRVSTGHDYHNLRIEQDLKGHSTREVICGNVTPGPPGERPQVCLRISGSVVGGRRSVRGGYYLPPKVPDLRRYRYACFGSAARSELCGMVKTPPGYPDAPIALGAGG